MDNYARFYKLYHTHDWFIFFSTRIRATYNGGGSSTAQTRNNNNYANTNNTNYCETMSKRLRNTIVITQNLFITFALVFFLWDCTTQNYTSFTLSPPNNADKMWYLGEAIYFLGSGFIFVLFNMALLKCCDFADRYKDVWIAITIYFLIHFLWTITWIKFGLSANTNWAQAVLFGVILTSIIFIIFLPYLKKILKRTR